MSLAYRMDVSQVTGFAIKLAEHGATVGIALENALNNEAQIVATVAKELVPVDLGNLRSSIKVYPQAGAFHEGAELFVEIVAGDTAVKYAQVQEENESFHHNVGQAHYMRDATSVLIGMDKRIAGEVANHL